MADESQLLLLDEIDNLSPELAVTARRHSAAFLERENPRLVKAIRLLIALGISDKHIAEDCNVSTNLVAALRIGIKPLSVEDHKKRVIAGLQRLSLGLLQRMTEAVEGGEEIPFKDLAIGMGITTEKLELLLGNATQRVQHALTPEEQTIRDLLLRGSHGAGMVSGAGSLPANAGSTPAAPSPPPLIIDIQPGDD